MFDLVYEIRNNLLNDNDIQKERRIISILELLTYFVHLSHKHGFDASFFES